MNGMLLLYAFYDIREVPGASLLVRNTNKGGKVFHMNGMLLLYAFYDIREVPGASLLVRKTNKGGNSVP